MVKILIYCLYLFGVLKVLDGQGCNSDVCQTLAKEYKAVINKSADPCEDFSEYACGNYDKLHKLQPGQSSYSVFSEIDESLRQHFMELFNDDSIAKSTPQYKAVKLYKSCMNETGRDKFSQDSFVKMVQEISKQNNLENKLIKLMRTGTNARFFSLSVGADDKNPRFNILNLQPPGLILSSSILEKSTTPDNQKRIEAYKKYMKEILTVLGMENRIPLIDDLVAMNVEIAKILPSLSDMRNPIKAYNKYTVDQLSSECNEINWLTFINSVLNETGKSVKKTDNLIVFSKNYLSKMCGVLKKYKSSDKLSQIVNFDIEWAAILPLTKYGSNKMVDSRDALNSLLYGINGKEDQWKICIDYVSSDLLEIVGNMYVKKYFDPSQKKDIIKMVEKLRQTFDKILKGLTWMDSKTKAMAIKKLQTMTYKIGYPDSMIDEKKLASDHKTLLLEGPSYVELASQIFKFEFIKQMKNMNEKIPSDIWMMAPHMVNAYYNPPNNEIVFPAAILSYPLYSLDYPVTGKFSSIGMVIGHEILHGFDNSGSRYDHEGRLKEWWTPITRQKYTNKTMCIVKQYGEYEIYGEHLPSKQTLGEDIADNAGIRLAFMAAFSGMKNKENEKLNGLDYTPEQIFFLQYARTWCSVMTKDALIHKMKNDVHTTWKFRINGPLSNLPEFSKAFNCSASKPMNRKNKCQVW